MYEAFMGMVALGLCLDPALVCEYSIMKMQRTMSQTLKPLSKCEILVNRRIVYPGNLRKKRYPCGNSWTRNSSVLIAEVRSLQFPKKKVSISLFLGKAGIHTITLTSKQNDYSSVLRRTLHQFFFLN